MTLLTPVKHVAAIMREAALLNLDPQSTLAPNSSVVTEPDTNYQCPSTPTSQLAGRMHSSLDSSSARFLVSPTPIQSTMEPIPVIFQTPPPHQVATSWIAHATPEACHALNPYKLLEEIHYLRSALFDSQERNMDLAEKLIVAYTQLVLGSQYNGWLCCQLAAKENKKKGPSHKVLMDGLPHIITDTEFQDIVAENEATCATVQLRKKAHTCA